MPPPPPPLPKLYFVRDIFLEILFVSFSKETETTYFIGTLPLPNNGCKENLIKIFRRESSKVDSLKLFLQIMQNLYSTCKAPNKFPRFSLPFQNSVKNCN